MENGVSCMRDAFLNNTMKRRVPYTQFFTKEMLYLSISFV